MMNIIKYNIFSWDIRHPNNTKIYDTPDDLEQTI